ncbi:MAG: aspartate racemase [Promethearchaeia archaeon]|nr:MAG: aspartate racemase [Candidatus Lokiarchaeia archaeon]
MKKIGLIGGMTWESTLEYYRLLNEGIATRLGGYHSAHLILYSVDFDEIFKLMEENSWRKITQILTKIAIDLQDIGAEALLICTNTIHKIVPAMEALTSFTIPILHIIDATALKIQELGINKVGLIGTKISMEEEFLKERLLDKFQIETIIPSQSERDEINKVIFKELSFGKIRPESRQAFKTIINNLHHKGAEGVILGCTEIPLLIHQEDVSIPIFNTTKLHVESTLDFMLK